MCHEPVCARVPGLRTCPAAAEEAGKAQRRRLRAELAGTDLMAGPQGVIAREASRGDRARGSLVHSQRSGVTAPVTERANLDKHEITAPGTELISDTAVTADRGGRTRRRHSDAHRAAGRAPAGPRRSHNRQGQRRLVPRRRSWVPGGTGRQLGRAVASVQPPIPLPPFTSPGQCGGPGTLPEPPHVLLGAQHAVRGFQLAHPSPSVWVFSPGLGPARGPA